MEIKLHCTIHVLLILLLSSCCQITGNCPEPNKEEILDDSNPKVRLIVISNNSCKICKGDGNVAVENLLENKSTEKITVTYSYTSIMKQPDGNIVSTSIVLIREIGPKIRLSIACSCKMGLSTGEPIVNDIKIVKVE